MPLLSVLYVQRRTSQDGAQVSLSQFIPHLADLGIKPLVVVERDGFLSNYLSSCGIPVLFSRFPPWRSLHGWVAFWPFFSRSVKKFVELNAPDGVDVVHGNDVEEGGIAVALAKRLGCFSIIHVRGRDSSYERVIKYRGTEADGLVVLSKGMLRESRGWDGVRSVAQIYNCIDPSFYEKQLAEGPQIPAINSGEVTILVMGNGSEIKGWKYAAEAILAVQNNRKRLRWWFLGGSNENQVTEVKSIIEGLPQIINYTFWGHQEAVAPFYYAADLVLFPSLKESFGRVIIEAGLFSKPLVSARVGVAEEIIEDGKSGYLFEPGDPYDLAKALNKALSDENRVEKGRKLHETVMAKCSYTMHNSLLRTFYNQIILNKNKQC